MTSLNKRRAALQHSLEGLRATRDRQLDALNKTLNTMIDLRVQLIVVDNDIAAIIDTSLHRMDQYHQDNTHENSV